MADVQLEHGHVRIANQIVEAILAGDFTGTQVRILVALIRLTYGWRRKSVMITQPQLADLAGLRAVGGFRRALRELIDEGVVIEVERGTGQRPSSYALQKDFAKWGRFASAPARLQALWGERPDDADTLFALGPEPSSPTPQGQTTEPSVTPQGQSSSVTLGGNSDPTGSGRVTPQGQVGRPHRVTQTPDNPVPSGNLRARKDRKDRKDSHHLLKDADDDAARAKAGTAATADEPSPMPIGLRLVIAANMGMADNPAIGDRCQPIPAGAGTAAELAESVEQAGVDHAYAERWVYSTAKTYRPRGKYGQIKSMTYFRDGLLEAWEGFQAKTLAENGARPAALPSAARAYPDESERERQRRELREWAAREDGR